jgi:hypothetical protein
MPSAVSASPGLSLVLGMAFINAETARNVKSRSNTSVAPLRDRKRLLQLQAMGHDIITANDSVSSEQCAPQPHLQCSYSHRSVADLKALCASDSKLPLRAIYLDYFRFPGAYLTQAFSPFLQDMLPRLIKEDFIGPRTELIMLNAAELIQCVSETFEGTPIAAAAYPLYLATERTAAEDLGAYTSSQEIASYGHQPFVSFRLRSAAASSLSAQAASAPAAMTPLSYVEGKAHMSEFGWLLLPSNEERKDLAQQWLEWTSHREESLWSPKRGNYFQTNASGADVGVTLFDASQHAGREILSLALGSKAATMTLASQKVMRSEPGHGLQTEHCDAATLQEAEGCYTVIFYLTEGVSTYLPTTPHTKAVEQLCFNKSAAAAIRRKHEIPLSPYSVTVGSALALSHKILHHGPLNETASARITLFQHWVSGENAADIPDSELQRLPFGY